MMTNQVAKTTVQMVYCNIRYLEYHNVTDIENFKWKYQLVLHWQTTNLNDVNDKTLVKKWKKHYGNYRQHKYKYNEHVLKEVKWNLGLLTWRSV